MPEPKWITFLIYFIEDESMHFLFSAFMGFAGFYGISTMLFVLLLVWADLTRQTVSMGVVYGILICSILVGLALSAASHYFLDYVYTWYITPLGPSLNLIMP